MPPAGTIRIALQTNQYNTKVSKLNLCDSIFWSSRYCFRAVLPAITMVNSTQFITLLLGSEIKFSLTVFFAMKTMPAARPLKHETIAGSVIDIPGYSVLHRDRSSDHHGGVCLYINTVIRFKRLGDLLCCPDHEVLWVQLRPKRLPRGFLP